MPPERPPDQRKLTQEWLDSSECDWPPVIKDWAKKILKQSEELQALRKETTGINLFEPEKIKLLYMMGTLHNKIGQSYTNLAKELTYDLSRTNKDD